jgi:hypothetical protein
MSKECHVKFKCVVDKYKVLSKDKIYTCHEESKLYPGVYYVEGNNNLITSVSRDDWGLVFLDTLRIEKIDEILNFE